MKVRVEDFIAWGLQFQGTVEHSDKHREILRVYNSQKPLPRGYKMQENDAWCATFVTAIAVATGCADIFPCECSCFYMERNAGQKGYIVDRDVSKVGDIILYDWQQDGTSDHVGVVIQRDGTTLKVLEGNYNDKVGVRTLGIKSKNIRTVFRIPWDESKGGGGNVGAGSDRTGSNSGSVPNVSGSNVRPTGDSIDMVARDVIRGKWGNGAARRQALVQAGYDYTAVHKRVNEILKGGGK